MRRKVFGRSTQALLAANAVLALLIALQVLMPASPSASAMDSQSDDEAMMPEFGDVRLSPPAMSALSDMLERPLFFDDRRMPEPEKAEPPPPPTPLRLKLIGVALSQGTRVALLRNLVTNQLMHLAEGETHDGWTLDTLGAQSVSFSRGPQATELPLVLEGKSRERR